MVSILPAENYIEEIIESHGISKAKSCDSPGTSGRKTNDGISALSFAEALDYRGTVGKLTWVIPIRPDTNYAVKELRTTDSDRRRPRPCETGLEIPHRY